MKRSLIKNFAGISLIVAVLALMLFSLSSCGSPSVTSVQQDAIEKEIEKPATALRVFMAVSDILYP
ncbi:MAG: hypothetical protein JW738_07970 [Actinobacteria bacterium]|nr:hypothetical protein [Actinomycetota bacterium]